MLQDIKNNAKKAIEDIDQQIQKLETEIAQLQEIKNAYLAALGAKGVNTTVAKRGKSKDSRTIAESLVEVMANVKGPVQLRDLEKLLVDAGFSFKGATPRMSIYTAMKKNPKLFMHDAKKGWSLKASAYNTIMRKKGLDINI